MLFFRKLICRLIAAPIIIEGEEQRSNSGILLRLSMSIPRADFREILKDASIPLLEFYRDTVRMAELIYCNLSKSRIEIFCFFVFSVERNIAETTRNQCCDQADDNHVWHQ